MYREQKIKENFSFLQGCNWQKKHQLLEKNPKSPTEYGKGPPKERFVLRRDLTFSNRFAKIKSSTAGVAQW